MICVELRTCIFVLISVIQGVACKQMFEHGTVVAMTTDQTVSEVSGMGASRRHQDIIYVINDADARNGNKVYAMSSKHGGIMGTFELTGVTEDEWEDLSVGPGPGGASYVYILDTRSRPRSYLLLYRFKEPNAISSATIKPETLKISWNNFHDSEALMVDENGVVYIFKTVPLLSKPTIYRVPDVVWDGREISLVDKTDLPVLSTSGYAPRGADLSPDGMEILLTDHDRTNYWRKNPGESVIHALTSRDPLVVSYISENQRDTICWAADGSGYYTLSSGSNQPLLFFKKTSNIPFISTGSDTLSFTTIGDWGQPGIGQEAVANQMGKWSQAYNAQFVIALGDNFYDNGIASDTDSQIETTWRRVYTHPGLMKTWYVIAGNHDHRLNRAYNQIKLSRKDSRWYMPSLYYSFYKPVGNQLVHFIMIDTQTGRFGTDTTQLDWFQKELENSRGNWIIVCGHHPVFSTGDHGRFIETRGMYNNLRPLMEKHKVALYIAGHDHEMEHLVPKYSKIVDYVISGSGSKLRHQNSAALKDTIEKNVESVIFRSEYAFAGVQIKKDSATVAYVNTDGKVFHSFTKQNPRKIY